MGAKVGDEVVVGSPDSGDPGRIGIIVGLEDGDALLGEAAPDYGDAPDRGETPGHDGGAPGYVIHWVVGDYDSRVVPGPGLRIKLQHEAGRPDRLEGSR